MRVFVVGSGGVGSFVGGSLARAGFDVTLFGRGPHWRALAERGLEVRGARGSFHVDVATSADLEGARDFDVVLLAVKAHQIAPLAERLGALARAGCTIVTLQNGVPFWYFDGFEGPLEGTHLSTVDPGGAIARAIASRSLVACVVNAGNRIPQPGTVEHVGDASYALGTPSGEVTQRVGELVAALSSVDLDAVADAHIRRTIWAKLVGNATLNPVSALTRATAAEIVDDAAVVALMREAMQEQLCVGRALGIDLDLPIDERIAANRRFGDQRTSMLQDLDAGRPLELDPIVGAVVEVADLAGVAVPATRRLYALTRLLDGTSRAKVEA